MSKSSRGAMTIPHSSRKRVVVHLPAVTRASAADLDVGIRKAQRVGGGHGGGEESHLARTDGIGESLDASSIRS